MKGIFLFCALLAPAVWAQEPTAHLRVLATHDLHGALHPVVYPWSQERPVGGAQALNYVIYAACGNFCFILTESTLRQGPAMNELEQMQLAKIQAEIRKLSAESDKLMLETRWYPMVVTGALFGVIITFTKLFL
jgi:2',3'-cyclic-nucleotide 2'-phosphodiesterase (5'-nucleotidase family)